VHCRAGRELRAGGAAVVVACDHAVGARGPPGEAVSRGAALALAGAL